jgi:hypothetical protein
VDGPEWVQTALAGAGQTVAQVVAAIGAVSLWLTAQARAGGAVVAKLESAYEKVKKVRAAREATGPAAAAQKDLADKRRAEDEARHTLHDAEERMKALKAELAELAPGRQLIRFLKDRASADDYRRHLGLVSLVRRDFEQLSLLLTRATETKDDTLPQIDRIVLYIDDLDRCRADRVIEVLEAVHLLLAFPLFAVVVAVDPRWLRQSLLDRYPRLLGGASDAGRGKVRRLVRPATPQDYLEKVFQVPFHLQPMEKGGFDALVGRLFPVAAVPAAAPPPPVTPATPAPDPIPGPPKPPGLEPTDPRPVPPVTPPAPVPQPPKPAPPDPKRLSLTPAEAGDVLRFQPLFQTPRAVKRLANTYCLVRVGVGETDWSAFLGTPAAPGTYRVPMLLLAVTAAFPALARPWLHSLLEATPATWPLSEDDVRSLTDRHRDATDGADWERLAGGLGRLSLDDWRAPDAQLLATWVPRVARYSF